MSDLTAKQIQWLEARETRNPVLEAFRDSFDSYDPWGSVLEAHFQICYTLVRHGAKDSIPADWEFGLGAFQPTMDDNNPDVWDEDSDGSLLGWEFDLIMREHGAAPLIHAGNILSRYANLLRLDGKDY